MLLYGITLHSTFVALNPFLKLFFSFGFIFLLFLECFILKLELFCTTEVPYLHDL